MDFVLFIFLHSPLYHLHHPYNLLLHVIHVLHVISAMFPLLYHLIMQVLPPHLLQIHIHHARVLLPLPPPILPAFAIHIHLMYLLLSILLLPILHCPSPTQSKYCDLLDLLSTLIDLSY